MTALPPYPRFTALRARALSLWLLLLLAPLVSAAPLGVTIPVLNGTLDAPYILESDPDHDALRISLSARIVRNQPAAIAANVTARWRATLRQGGIVVAQTSHSTHHLVPGVYDAFVNVAFELDPPALLSDTAAYNLTFESFYVNDPAAPLAFTPGDTAILFMQDFGHFSGVVNFTGNTGTLTSFGAPAPLFLDPGWQLAAFTGTLSNGLAFAHSLNSQPLVTTRNAATGDLTVSSGSAEIDDGNGQFTWGAWSGTRGPVLVSNTGIAATNFRLTLPPGIGWRDGGTGALRTIFRSETVQLPLNASLQPSVASVSGAIPPGREFVGAALPVAFTPPTFKFDGTSLILTTPGTRFLRHSRYQQEVAVTGKLPRSNDSFFRFLRPTAGTDLELRHAAAGAMSVTLRTDAGEYNTHFPDAGISGLASSLRIAADSVVSTASSLLANWVHLQYDKGCPQNGNSVPQDMRLLAPVLTATPQGGITATGSLASSFQVPGVARHLEIGRNSGGQPVHETAFFATARFYAPGFSAALTVSPVEFLLAEVQPGPTQELGLPGTTAYADGLGLYAGFNFDYPNAMHVRSRTGGAAPIEYAVTTRRAYARLSGVSGVIQALGAEMPFQADIYGFPVSFTDWAFNFLSNEMRDSWIEGQVDLTDTYAGFTQGMENVHISCCGNLEGFDIPEGEANKRLAHWQDFEIRNSSARFVTPDPCDSSSAVLAYSTTVEINGLPGRKAGRLAFHPDGSLTIPNDAAWDDAPSFLSLEPQSGLAGQYRWWPRGDAYFSNPDGQQAASGFVTAAGDLDMPYFNLSTVRIHTTAVEETADEVLVGFMHGDYLAEGAVDEFHLGVPAAGVSPADYQGDATRRPIASAAFFGKPNAWNYPVQYHTATQNFYSPEDKATDLWIADFQSRISRLNAELAHMRFGVQINGVTQLSVGTLIEEATEYGAEGLAAIISEGITTPVKEGMLALAETLDNKLEKLIGNALNQVMQVPAEGILDGIRTLNGGWGEAQVDAVILPRTDELKQAIQKLGQFETGTDEIASAISEIDERLGKVQGALNAVILLLNGDPEGLGPLEPLVKRVLAHYGYDENDGDFDFVMGQAQYAVQESAGLLAGVDAGWLADAREALQTLHDGIAEARARLQQGEEFFMELNTLFGDATALTEIVDALREQISVRITAQMQGRLPEFTDAEILDVIHGAIRDNLLDSILSVRLQSLLRARLGYLDTMVNDAINFAMQAISEVVTEALQESGLLDALNSVFETLSGALSYLKAARISGEAITRGDRLAELSIQAEVDFSIPTPAGVGLPMSADAMIKWQERISDADTPCNGPVGEIVPEVILKASGGSAIGFGADSRASIAVKFAFQEDYTPAGFAGVLEIDSSRFNISGMGIQDFSAALALGEHDYYLSAHAAGSFGAGGTSVDLEGGFFVGQTCNTEVFGFYPNFPGADNLGAGPYRGVVAHLSGKAPLISAGGLLDVTLGAEIGGYAMAVQGPDDEWDPAFGGLLGGSISGEALFLLKATGSLELGYGYMGGVHRFDGNAGVEVKLGFEPFQITKSKNFHVIYRKPVGGNGDWEVNP